METPGPHFPGKLGTPLGNGDPLLPPLHNFTVNVPYPNDGCSGHCLLMICHIYGEMPNHAGDPHMSVVMVCHTDCPTYSWENSQPYRGSQFSPRDPHISGKIGILGPHFRGSHFHMTPKKIIIIIYDL